LRKTLTYDCGKEMAQHEKLAEQTQMKIYFADPHCPWQRGSNENTNGLLRQYLPKGMDLSVLSQVALNRIAREMLWMLHFRFEAALYCFLESRHVWTP
jgi:IS30 family transposase